MMTRQEVKSKHITTNIDSFSGTRNTSLLNTEWSFPHQLLCVICISPATFLCALSINKRNTCVSGYLCWTTAWKNLSDLTTAACPRNDQTLYLVMGQVLCIIQTNFLGFVSLMYSRWFMWLEDTHKIKCHLSKPIALQVSMV